MLRYFYQTSKTDLMTWKNAQSLQSSVKHLQPLRLTEITEKRDI